MLKDPNKKLKQGFSVIGDMCGTLKLGNMVRDRACELYVLSTLAPLTPLAPLFFVCSERTSFARECPREGLTLLLVAALPVC